MSFDNFMLPELFSCSFHRDLKPTALLVLTYHSGSKSHMIQESYSETRNDFCNYYEMAVCLEIIHLVRTQSFLKY